MKRIIVAVLATAALASTALAEDYDRLLEAIHIPQGAYFNTGCIVTDNPRIIADVSLETTADFDLFAVRQRVAGCWILNCGAGQFWYRYGTAAHGPGVGAYSVWQRLQIECGKTIVVNGTPLWTAEDFDFSANDTTMEVPGRQYLQDCTLRSFKIEDGGQLVRDFVPAKKDGACGLYDRVNDKFYANAGTGTVTEEVNLRSNAIEDANGKPTVISDGTAVWEDGLEADKVFDGSLSTFYDPQRAAWDTYVGYGLIKPCVVTRIRVYGRRNTSETPARLKAAVIEGANSSDFSDAVVLHRFSQSVPDDWYQNQRWIEVVPDVTASFQYYRIIQRQVGTENTFAGSVAELEFYGIDADSFAGYLADNIRPPADLAVTRGAYPVVANTLTWSRGVGSSDTSILRSSGPNGPWTEIARAAGSSYADTTAPAGVVSYYRIAANYSVNGANISLTNDAPASIVRWRLLERDPSDMTQLRAGVSLIYNCSCGCWTPETAYNWPAVTNSLMIAFNDIVWQNDWSTQTPQGHVYAMDFADVAAASPRTCIGVDIGEPAHLALMRVYPRLPSTNPNGMVLSGSNSTDWNLDGNFDTLTEPVSGVAGNGTGTWIERPSLDAETAYRYLFCHNPDNNGWNDNVSELQFYGWTESDAAAVAQGVADITVACGTTPSVTLSWTPAKYGTYTIERKTGDGAWTSVASALPAATATWTDSNVTCDGTRYTYRITTVNGAGEAYSEECEVVPYLVGNGTGLHAEWWTNFVATTGGEALALVATNAAIDIANASVGGETENILARWSGKLIAPCAGDFTFDAQASGVAYLWIDGNPVLYKDVQSGAASLTSGEHDITVKWLHKDGVGHCRILWGGCVTHEVIPETQLLPVPPRALPEGWVNARSFDVSAGSNWLGDVKANADGSFDVAHSGRDLSWGTVGYDFMWQEIKGDFTITAKLESLASDDAWNGRKAGLMVRSSLDATSKMRAYGVKRTGGNFYLVGVQKTTGTEPYVREQDKVAGAPLSSYSAAPTWVRLRRKGNVFTCDYKTAETDQKWVKHYEYEDVNDEYGETTYVGLAAWGEGDGGYTAVPYYLWRLSDVRLKTPEGMAIYIR